MRDARAIRDTSRLNLSALPPGGTLGGTPGSPLEGTAPWVLLEVTPGPKSGQGVLKGGYIDGETGKLVTPPGARVVVTIEGTCKVLTVLAGKTTRNTWSYRWEQEELSRIKEDREAYSPFRMGGGAVVCALDEKGAGASLFRDIYLLPAGWEGFVVEAMNYLRAAPDLFLKENLPKRRGRLEEHLRHKNPLVAVAACRSLCEGGLEKRFPEVFLAGAEKHRQALFLLLALQSPSREVASEILQGTRRVIESATSAKDLDGIALGALVASGQPSGRPEHDLGLEVLRTLRRRLDDLSAGGKEVRYLRAVLGSAGLLPPGAGGEKVR